MTYRSLRRRMSQASATHDWFEIVSTALGLVFLLLAGVCVWGIVTAVASFGDADREFKTTVGFLQVTRGFGIVLFSLLGLLAFGVGWFLAGDAARRLGRRLLRRR